MVDQRGPKGAVAGGRGQRRGRVESHLIGPRRGPAGAAPLQHVEPGAVDVVVRIEETPSITVIGKGESEGSSHAK